VLQIFDWPQDTVSVWVQEVGKAEPIGDAIWPAAVGLCRDAVPGRFQPSCGPKLHHVADIDQDHVFVDWDVSPDFVLRHGWRRVARRADLEAPKCLLEEKLYPLLAMLVL
jgi:hypothetical protein